MNVRENAARIATQFEGRCTCAAMDGGVDCPWCQVYLRRAPGLSDHAAPRAPGRGPGAEALTHRGLTASDQALARLAARLQAALQERDELVPRVARGAFPVGGGIREVEKRVARVRVAMELVGLAVLVELR